MHKSFSCSAQGDFRPRWIIPNKHLTGGRVSVETEADKERFDLFEYAYIGARYDKDFKISQEDLEYLSKRVKLLLSLTEKLCKEKIKNFKNTKTKI